MATIMRVGGGAGGGKSANPAVSTLAEESVLLIMENGVPTEYYIDKHDYEPELNTNRTLLTRKDLHSDRQWNATNSSAYATSDIDEWLNGEFYNSLSAGVRELIGTTTFPYTIGAGNYTVSTLTRAVFLLSATELGLSSGGYSRVEGTKLPIADALKIAYYNGTAQNHWLRSPYCEGGVAVFFVDTSGTLKTYNTSYTRYARPSFTIPSSAKVVGPDNMGRYTLEVDYVAEVYGIARDITASSPEWVRTDGAMTFSATASIGTVAGASDFDNIYPWSEMQRVTLDSGDVMVRIPKFYYGRYRNGNIERIQISGRADVGLTLHPAFNHAGVEQDCIYVGAYKAGIDQTVSSNWKATSKSGVAPMTGGTRNQFRLWSKAKGSGWGLIDISTLSAIQMLYLVEFANNNSQQMIGRGYCDGNTAKINTGSCDIVPNLTGRPTGTDGKTDIVYRGIEGIWGNLWEFVDGVNWNGGTYYVCNDPSKYADDTATNYSRLSFTGSTGWRGSFISQEGLDANGNPHIILPAACSGGSETTYECDSTWSDAGWKTIRRGGSWAYGSSCGLFASILDFPSSGSDTNLGSRLIYIPQ